MTAKRGVVFLLEETDFSEEAALLTGRFSGHHQLDDELGDRIDDAPPEVAIAWARDRADQVWIRLADDDVRYWAGVPGDAASPRWPPPQPLRPRRRPGEEWRDRCPSDPPTTWFVLVDLSPPFEDPRPDWDAVVKEIATRSGAKHFRSATLVVPESESFGYVPAVLQVPDSLRMALLSGAEPDADLDGYDLTGYQLELHVEASTADEAMRDAVRLCDAPRRWAVVAWTYPLDQHKEPGA